jgi:hypothetical protein
VKAVPLIAVALGGAALGALALHFLAPSVAPDGDEAKTVAFSPADSSGLHVDAETRARAGIRVAAPRPATVQVEESGYARAIDLTALSGIASDIQTAQAAAIASGREAARLAGLARTDQSAAQREVEAARAQAVADLARLTQACQRVGLEFGAGLARMGCGAIPAFAREAAAGQVAVLRIDFPDGPPSVGTAVTVGTGNGDVAVRVLGPAVAGDTQLQTAGVLALVRGSATAHAGVGRILSARVASGGSTSGFVIPREALVRADGALYAYKAQGADGFERVPLEGATPRSDGWFVPAGRVKADDRIVVSGAGTLLGLEHVAPPAGDD